MEARRHRDDGDVETGGCQPRDVGQHLQASRDTVRIARRVRDGDELDALDLAQEPRVVTPHHPEAEQSRAQDGAHAPAPATAVTAATMRPRSSSLSEGCTGSDTTSRAALSVCGRSSPGAKRVSEGRRWFGIG